ncbi:type IV pilus biogenesis/stability protein PilW [Neisseria animalis]|uniref:Type IV pilus biogenesis/stability protein PilW n=1 Tax=Neisseria animalis TaxID=492 RepID=A0A5P3MTG9_NEIAN|nr:type IV pilus biogenesis/stability protein PilW [Neisseria animalis]QEY24903.1 type IV pilus biogenesis/stability protein PilW [Neisseria animalis]ROW32014.1 type IV pilus biogenesis/stability protein PilW [Neisseria animalis]
MKANWLPVLSACILAACGTNLGSEAKMRAEQVSDIKTRLALEYMRSENYRQATASIEEALGANRKNEAAWLVRAGIYQYLKVDDKAQESFRTALSLKPDSAEANNNYGWFVCSRLNRPAEAIAYFDKALADPTYPTPYVAHFNKGVCSAKSGQYALADAYFERALAANPEFAPVFKEWARAKWQQGRLSEANSHFRQYLNQTNGLLPADDLLLGWQLAQASGDTRQAAIYEEQLKARFPYSEALQTITTGR